MTVVVNWIQVRWSKPQSHFGPASWILPLYCHAAHESALDAQQGEETDVYENRHMCGPVQKK